MFENSRFIKSDNNRPDDYGGNAYAPIFQKTFSYDGNGVAILNTCMLGMGYAYLNGRRISDDLFCAPVSDYRKTLWYSSYNVTDFLKKGNNTIMVILGNGFYNENFQSAWDFDTVA